MTEVMVDDVCVMGRWVGGVFIGAIYRSNK